MHFAPAPHASGNKSIKLALVVVFHVLLGLGLVKTMNVKLLAPPGVPPVVDLIPGSTPPVAEPPPATLPVAQLPAPPIVAPMPDVTIPTPPTQNVVTTTTTTVTEPAEPAHPPGTIATPPLTGGTGVTPPATAAVHAAAMLDGCTRPAYPAQAARDGSSGTVTLALLVGVDGRVTGARIARSSGFRELDKAAVTALSLCTFKPAMQGDVAQAGWTQIAYDFKLE